METTELKDRVVALIRTMESHARQLDPGAGTVPALDRDLLLQDTRTLYALLLELGRVVDAAVPAASEPAREPVTAAAPEAAETPRQDTRAAEETAAEETAAPEPVEPKVSRKRAGHLAAAKPEPKTGGLFDEVQVDDKKEEKQSLYDKISRAKEGPSLADKLSALPARDLKRLIGINEKFKFVNELFDGNLQEYNACIGQANDARSAAEAEALIEASAVGKFDADTGSETYLSLLGLVRKRFAS
jgi:hypothetical protein